MHLRKAVLTIYVVYLTSGIGAKGTNITKMHQIMRSYDHARGPVLMVGDWNMDIDELTPTGLFCDKEAAYRNLAPMLPDTTLTCATGKGRVIDYAVANAQANAIMTDVMVDDTAPWKHTRVYVLNSKE